MVFLRDYTETYSGVVRHATFRLFLPVCAAMGLILTGADVIYVLTISHTHRHTQNSRSLRVCRYMYGSLQQSHRCASQSVE